MEGAVHGFLSMTPKVAATEQTLGYLTTVLSRTSGEEAQTTRPVC
jgi:hypothetical protein